MDPGWGAGMKEKEGGGEGWVKRLEFGDSPTSANR